MDKLKVLLNNNRRNSKTIQEREIQWVIAKATKRDGKDPSKDKKAATRNKSNKKKMKLF